MEHYLKYIKYKKKYLELIGGACLTRAIGTEESEEQKIIRENMEKIACSTVYDYETEYLITNESQNEVQVSDISNIPVNRINTIIYNLYVKDLAQINRTLWELEIRNPQSAQLVYETIKISLSIFLYQNPAFITAEFITLITNYESRFNLDSRRHDYLKDNVKFIVNTLFSYINSGKRFFAIPILFQNGGHYQALVFEINVNNIKIHLINTLSHATSISEFTRNIEPIIKEITKRNPKIKISIKTSATSLQEHGNSCGDIALTICYSILLSNDINAWTILYGKTGTGPQEIRNLRQLFQYITTNRDKIKCSEACTRLSSSVSKSSKTEKCDSKDPNCGKIMGKHSHQYFCDKCSIKKLELQEALLEIDKKLSFERCSTCSKKDDELCDKCTLNYTKFLEEIEKKQPTETEVIDRDLPTMLRTEIYDCILEIIGRLDVQQRYMTIFIRDIYKGRIDSLRDSTTEISRIDNQKIIDFYGNDSKNVILNFVDVQRDEEGNTILNQQFRIQITSTLNSINRSLGEFMPEIRASVPITPVVTTTSLITSVPSTVSSSKIDVLVPVDTKPEVPVPVPVAKASKIKVPSPKIQVPVPVAKASKIKVPSPKIQVPVPVPVAKATKLQVPVPVAKASKIKVPSPKIQVPVLVPVRSQTPVKKTTPVKPSTLIEKTTSSISRFQKVLTKEKRDEILRDSKKDKKTKNWIWYGLPQLIPEDYPINTDYSENTIKYAITIEEAIMFLSDSTLLDYYNKLLINLSSKPNLKNYFGNYDYNKFKRHLEIFHIAMTNLIMFNSESPNQELYRGINDLIELLKTKIEMEESKKGGSTEEKDTNILKNSNSLFILTFNALYLANQIIENFDKSEEKEPIKKSEE